MKLSNELVGRKHCPFDKRKRKRERINSDRINSGLLETDGKRKKWIYEYETIA